MAKSKNRFLEEEWSIYQTQSEILSVNKFKRLVLSIFEYKDSSGLVDNEFFRQIERNMFKFGKVCVLKTDGNEIIALPYTRWGGLNIYGLPIQWQCVGVNKWYRRNKKNSVLGFNDNIRMPSITYIAHIIKKCENIERVVEQNLNALKQPFIFEGSKEQLLTMYNKFKQITGSDWAIFEDKVVGTDQFSMKVHQTGVEFISDKLLKLREFYEGKILRYFGIKYSDKDKTERLVVDEANAGNEFSECNLYNMLHERELMCKQINEMFGTNISVSINERLKEKGEENEQIHD